MKIGIILGLSESNETLRQWRNGWPSDAATRQGSTTYELLTCGTSTPLLSTSLHPMAAKKTMRPQCAGMVRCG